MGLFLNPFFKQSLKIMCNIIIFLPNKIIDRKRTGLTKQGSHGPLLRTRTRCRDPLVFFSSRHPKKIKAELSLISHPKRVNE